jgi:hypothetical protein
MGIGVRSAKDHAIPNLSILTIRYLYSTSQILQWKINTRQVPTLSETAFACKGNRGTAI